MLYIQNITAKPGTPLPQKLALEKGTDYKLLKLEPSHDPLCLCSQPGLEKGTDYKLLKLELATKSLAE